MSASSEKKRKRSSRFPPAKKVKESLSADPQLQLVNASLILSVPPIFASNPAAGVEEMLDSLIMRYTASLQGIVLSHSNLKFLKNTALIHADCPFLICTISFDAIVWSPRVGQRLLAKVNLCSPDHVSLLVNRTFNASIPRHHIPTETWEFEYGPAENDTEYGETHDDAVIDPNGRGIGHASDGKWVHRITGEKLGGKDGVLELTVIGLTVANEMLSVLGSLQPDPFSPRHTNKHTMNLKKNSNKESKGAADGNLKSDSESSGSGSE